jgi:hypothetical protein
MACQYSQNHALFRQTHATKAFIWRVKIAYHGFVDPNKWSKLGAQIIKPFQLATQVSVNWYLRVGPRDAMGERKLFGRLAQILLLLLLLLELAILLLLFSWREFSLRFCPALCSSRLLSLLGALFFELSGLQSGSEEQSYNYHVIFKCGTNLLPDRSSQSGLMPASHAGCSGNCPKARSSIEKTQVSTKHLLLNDRLICNQVSSILDIPVWLPLSPRCIQFGSWC